MSQSHNEHVTCPVCGHEQDFQAWEQIDVADHPELKERLISGELNCLVCSECNAATDVLYPLVYRDPVSYLMIWMLPGENVPEDDAEPFGPLDETTAHLYQFRLVRTINDLREKVLIAECGFDDRIMELFKALIRHDAKSGIHPSDMMLFAGVEEENSASVAEFAVLRGPEQHGFSIPFEVLSKFSQEAEEKAKGVFKSARRWQQVNQQTTARGMVDSGIE